MEKGFEIIIYAIEVAGFYTVSNTFLDLLCLWITLFQLAFPIRVDLAQDEVKDPMRTDIV